MPRAEITHWKGQDKQVEREGVVGWGKGKVSKGGESKGLSLQIPLAHSKRSLILQDIIYLFIQYLDCLMDILLSFVFLFTPRAIDILFLFFSRSLHLSFFLRICETIEMKFRKDLPPKKRVEKQKFYLFNFRTCPTFCTLFTYIFFFQKENKNFFLSNGFLRVMERNQNGRRQNGGAFWRHFIPGGKSSLHFNWLIN